MITVKSRIKTIKPGDPGFMIADGLTTSSRASIEISADCPGRYRDIIAECFNRGWIKPVAHMYDKELTMDYLRSQT